MQQLFLVKEVVRVIRKSTSYNFCNLRQIRSNNWFNGRFRIFPRRGTHPYYAYVACFTGVRPRQTLAEQAGPTGG